MSAIDLANVSKGMSSSGGKRNGYLVKAPGENSGNNKGIPVQDKVRNLKADLRRSTGI